MDVVSIDLSLQALRNLNVKQLQYDFRDKRQVRIECSEFYNSPEQANDVIQSLLDSSVEGRKDEVIFWVLYPITERLLNAAQQDGPNNFTKTTEAVTEFANLGLAGPLAAKVSLYVYNMMKANIMKAERAGSLARFWSREYTVIVILASRKLLHHCEEAPIRECMLFFAETLPWSIIPLYHMLRLLLPTNSRRQPLKLVQLGINDIAELERRCDIVIHQQGDEHAIQAYEDLKRMMVGERVVGGEPDEAASSASRNHESNEQAQKRLYFIKGRRIEIKDRMECMMAWDSKCKRLIAGTMSDVLVYNESGKLVQRHEGSMDSGKQCLRSFCVVGANDSRPANILLASYSAGKSDSSIKAYGIGPGSSNAISPPPKFTHRTNEHYAAPMLTLSHKNEVLAVKSGNHASMSDINTHDTSRMHLIKLDNGGLQMEKCFQLVKDMQVTKMVQGRADVNQVFVAGQYKQQVPCMYMYDLRLANQKPICTLFPDRRQHKAGANILLGQPIAAHDDNILSIDTSGFLVASCSRDGALRIWDIRQVNTFLAQLQDYAANQGQVPRTLGRADMGRPQPGKSTRWTGLKSVLYKGGGGGEWKVDKTFYQAKFLSGESPVLAVSGYQGVLGVIDVHQVGDGSKFVGAESVGMEVGNVRSRCNYQALGWVEGRSVLYGQCSSGHVVDVYRYQ